MSNDRVPEKPESDPSSAGGGLKRRDLLMSGSMGDDIGMRNLGA
jgi:hypothetical protein